MEIRKERQTHRSKGQENSLAGGKRCERWLWVKGCAAGVEAGGRRHRILCTKLVLPGVATLLQHSSQCFQKPGKTDSDLLPVNANNRAVCLRVRHDVSRKELVVIGARRGRAPGAHITLNLPAPKIRGPATQEV